MDKQQRMVPLEALKAERKKGKMRLIKMQEQIENTQLEQLTQSATEDSHVEEITVGDAQNYLKEFAELVQNPYYSDSTQHVEELTEYAKTHGVTLKTAYNALFAEQKYDEIRKQAEASAIGAQHARQARKVDAIDSGSVPSPVAVKLTDEQIYIAERCGMTPDEYQKYMK